MELENWDRDDFFDEVSFTDEDIYDNHTMNDTVDMTSSHNYAHHIGETNKGEFEESNSNMTYE